MPLGDPEFKRDPQSHYARLRRDHPVASVRLPGRRRAWIVSRYDDVVNGLQDRRLVKDPRNVPGRGAQTPWTPGFLAPLTQNMLDLDGSDHRRLRDLVQPAFTRARIEAMEPRVHALVDSLIDRVENDRQMSLVEDFALPIPATIIAELIGAPVEDFPRFHRWSNAMVGADSSAFGRIKAIPSVLSFLRYMRNLIRKRRESPSDDLLSDLVRVELEGDQLSEDELIGMVFLLLVAGHETTVHLISGSVLALLERPDQGQQFLESDDRDRSVDELVRFTSPVELATERYAAETIHWHDATIAKGDLVLLSLASANHDPAQFDAPGELRLDRSPNRHVAFGRGLHFCLGAPLARLEAGIAITRLLARCPTLELAVDPADLRWRKSLTLRGLEELPLIW